MTDRSLLGSKVIVGIADRQKDNDSLNRNGVPTNSGVSSDRSFID
jgi:hypothetical protein